MGNSNSSKITLIPVMIAFFTMGFVDLVGIALVGYGNSNVFSIIFSQALLSVPEKKNEVSGLMIMGLFGGTIFPLFMGIVSDWMQSQIGAVAIMSIGVFYLRLMMKIGR